MPARPKNLFTRNDISNYPPMKLREKGNGVPSRYMLVATSFDASDALAQYAVNGQAIL